MKMPSLELRDGSCHLIGDITMMTAHTLPTKPGNAESDTIIDLAGVGDTDSALIALLTQWKRSAKKRGVVIRLKNCPDNVLSLIHLYGLDRFFKEAP